MIWTGNSAFLPIFPGRGSSQDAFYEDGRPGWKTDLVCRGTKLEGGFTALPKHIKDYVMAHKPEFSMRRKPGVSPIKQLDFLQTAPGDGEIK
jgi:hypothetical protein